MSFASYVRDMTQKYRLAISIAVLKSKPDNLSVEQYIEKLKSKYHSDMETDGDLNNMSICSEDFNFDEDEIEAINNGFNDSFGENTASFHDNPASQTILNDSCTEMVTNNENNEKENSFTEVLEILKNIDDNTIAEASQSVYYEDSQIFDCPTSNTVTTKGIEKTFTENGGNLNFNGPDIKSKPEVKSNKVNLDPEITMSEQYCNLFDSQATEVNTLPLFSQNYTHVSQSQVEDIVVPRKHLYGNAYNGNSNGSHVGNIENGHETRGRNIENGNEKHGGNIENGNADVRNNNENDDTNIESFSKTENSFERNVERIEIITQDCGMEDAFAYAFSRSDTMQVVMPRESMYLQENREFDSEPHTQYTNTKLMNCSVESSRIQYIIDGKGITYQIFKLNSDNLIVDPKSQTIEAKLAQSRTKHVTNTQDTETHVADTQIDVTDTQNHVTKTQVDFAHATNSQKDFNVPYAQDISSQEFITNTQVVVTNIQEDVTKTQRFHNNVTNTQTQNTNSLSEHELTKSQMEVVSFKVIEELNRIKGFLDRKSQSNSITDSGYRSDSQKSVRNSTQQPSGWLDQSAYCLYSYLLDCQLISSTREITGEISQVLGRLIDRLHEEEHYPSFLAAILESIDTIIEEVIVGDSYGEDVLLKKDENIQRLCLLNKSVHTLKYTIEKITDRLENVHTNLSNKQSLYETTNIEHCENVCYIFHILEICLQRYVEVKDISSQSSQNSQEKENLLKRTSITDIWRKKWIPNYKEDGGENICMEKRCALTKCGEVLNKIVVECMEGYSLMSFAALQCFNLLQNQ